MLYLCICHSWFRLIDLSTGKSTFMDRWLIFKKKWFKFKMMWCWLFVDYCDIFFSCLNSHSDGTHSLQRRGVMPIQSEEARAPSEFWAKWIFNAAFKRQKIHQGDEIVQCVISSAAKFKSLTGWCWGRYRRVFTALRIITNHTQFCWAYECND